MTSGSYTVWRRCRRGGQESCEIAACTNQYQRDPTGFAFAVNMLPAKKCCTQDQGLTNNRHMTSSPSSVSIGKSSGGNGAVRLGNV